MFIKHKKFDFENEKIIYFSTMKIKRALIILSDHLLTEILKIILSKLNISVDSTEEFKEALPLIEEYKYHLIIVGENKSLIAKNKMGEIILEKHTHHIPHIIMLKKEGEYIASHKNITTMNYPTLHKELTSIINHLNSQTKQQTLTPKTLIKNRYYRPVMNIAEFFHKLRGNKKIDFRSDEKQLNTILLGGKFYVIHSDFENETEIFTAPRLEASEEDLDIIELVSINLKTLPQHASKDLIKKGLNRINSPNALWSLLPEDKPFGVVKAPNYILKDCLPDYNAQEIQSLIYSKTIDLTSLKEQYKDNTELARALVCMYMTNMMEISKDADEIASSKYEVKIKKSLLRKILDKIRGL